jgi:hypothetical protein
MSSHSPTSLKSSPREFGGYILPPANKGFDVLTDDGVRIHVKSRRVSSSSPGDNGIQWYTCTRVGAKADGSVIAADRVSVVVYLDYRPYALSDFPVEMRDDVLVLKCSGLYFQLSFGRSRSTQVEMGGQGPRRTARLPTPEPTFSGVCIPASEWEPAKTSALYGEGTPSPRSVLRRFGHPGIPVGCPGHHRPIKPGSGRLILRGSGDHRNPCDW